MEKKTDTIRKEIILVGQKDKLISRLKSRSSAFSFKDAETLLNYLGYYRSNKGKTSGSRVMFINGKNKDKILFHRPHPGKELREYQIRQLIEKLEEEGLI